MCSLKKSWCLEKTVFRLYAETEYDYSRWMSKVWSSNAIPNKNMYVGLRLAIVEI